VKTSRRCAEGRLSILICGSPFCLVNQFVAISLPQSLAFSVVLRYSELFRFKCCLANIIILMVGPVSSALLSHCVFYLPSSSANTTILCDCLQLENSASITPATNSILHPTISTIYPELRRSPSTLSPCQGVQPMDKIRIRRFPNQQRKEEERRQQMEPGKIVHHAESVERYVTEKGHTAAHAVRRARHVQATRQS